jgi:predicted porin
MKKALVAAAVAGAFAAAPAMAAELSTNIYWSQGIAVGDITTSEATDAANNGKVDQGQVNDGGGNRLMLTWSDTLDNGMGLTAYVGFGNLGFSNNEPSFAANGVSLRNSHIALSGDHGTVAYGTTETMSELDLIMDPMAGDYGNGADPLAFINIGQTGANFTRRDGEAIWWNSKDINGFQLKAFYTFGPQDQTANADPDGLQLGIVYNSGPLMIGLNQATYSDYASSMRETAAGSGTQPAVDPVEGNEGQMTSFRATYDFGAFSVGGAVWDIEQSFSAGNEHTDSLGAVNNKYQVNGRMFIVKMPVASGTVWLQSSTLSDIDATVAATGVSASIRDSGKDGLDVGYVTPMNANVNAFVRYASSETGVNFDSTDGATDREEYMIGLQLSY